MIVAMALLHNEGISSKFGASLGCCTFVARAGAGLVSVGLGSCEL
jgi:hypothetical protein